MEENNSLGEIFETVFHKWNKAERRLKKKALRRAHRGTNFKTTTAKAGYKRIKVPGSNRYVRVAQSPTERVRKKQIGHQLGVRGHLFK